MTSIFANNKNKKEFEKEDDTNEEDEDYDVDRFLFPFTIKNKEYMVNAIQINVNDINDKFTPLYNPSIENVLTYMEEYCNILQQNGKPCFNQQQIKQKVETFFEEEQNWDLANNYTRDVILEKILTVKQFQEFKDFKMIDFEAPDGGSRKKCKKSKNTRRNKYKKPNRTRLTRKTRKTRKRRKSKRYT